MSLLRIAARIALSQPLSERRDYGSPEPSVAQQEETSVVEKTPGKGYCVKSEKNPDWSGGCYPSKSEAKERLGEVEMFKHMKKGSSQFSAAPSGVKIVKFEWDPGDKRSYGSFEVEAETPIGLLVGEGRIDSGGGSDDSTWTLNGQPLPDGVDHPDLGIPHYYAGHRAMQRFDKVKDTELLETITEWIAENAEYLGQE